MHNPFAKTPAVVPQVIMLPGLLFLAAAVLKYGFGQGFLFDPLEGFFTNDLVETVTVLSPLVALVLSTAALLEVRLESGQDTWSGTVTVRRKSGHFVAFACSAALTITFAAYFITENYVFVRLG